MIKEEYMRSLAAEQEQAIKMKQSIEQADNGSPGGEEGRFE